MSTDILLEDPAWECLGDVEALALRAVNSVFPSKPCTVTVLFSNDAEIRELNRQFRKKDKATNVLSFPASLMPVPAGEMAHLGDIVLAFETVAAEAQAAHKTLADHVTHLIVHGTLHLLGHDHTIEEDAEKMEQREREIMASLGIADPYAT
jgi:probable rRNA maturation factor